MDSVRKVMSGMSGKGVPMSDDELRVRVEKLVQDNPNQPGIAALLNPDNREIGAIFVSAIEKSKRFARPDDEDEDNDKNKISNFMRDFKKACEFAGLPNAKVNDILDRTMPSDWMENALRIGALDQTRLLARTIWWLQKEQDKKPILVLCAPTREGKTMAACFAVMHAVAKDTKLKMKRWMSFTDYSNWVGNFNHDEERALFEGRRFIAIDELRPIDDLGVRRPVAVASALLNMVDTRANNGYKTIFCTTMTVPKLRASFAADVICRFEEYGIIYDMHPQGISAPTQGQVAKAPKRQSLVPQSYAPPIGREPGQDG